MKFDVAVITHKGGPQDWITLTSSPAFKKIAGRTTIYSNQESYKKGRLPDLFLIRSFLGSGLSLLKEEVTANDRLNFPLMRFLVSRSIRFTFGLHFWREEKVSELWRERILTSKHLKTWSDFKKQGEGEWLIVLEGDAGHKGTESARFLFELKEAAVGNLDESSVYFLADGVPLSKIPGPIESRSNFLGREYIQTKFPFANTTCAYLISRSATELIGDQNNLNPFCLPADWLLTLLMSRHRLASKLFIPGPFNHGSQTRSESSVRGKKRSVKSNLKKTKIIL